MFPYLEVWITSVTHRWTDGEREKDRLTLQYQMSLYYVVQPEIIGYLFGYWWKYCYDFNQCHITPAA